MRRAALALDVCLAAGLAACATVSQTQTEKGGLVPLDVSAAAVARAHQPRRLALLIGIGDFDDPAWRHLRYASKDAADFARVLADPSKGAFGHVETLSSNATRAAIERALDRLAALDRDENDTVVVYVSSHGTLERDDKGELRRYLVARDTKMADIAGTGLSMDELKEKFDALRSRRKVLVLATCHSGGGKSLLPGDVQRELASTKGGFFTRPLEEVSKASVILAACDWGETAREDERLENDIYTHYLVEALTLGADRNGDGAVTASEAHDYARRMTYEFTHGQQRPAAESNEVGADPIVLVGKVERAGKPELYSYAPELDGFTMRIDGKPIADLPGGVALDAGRHEVQIAKGGGPAVIAGEVSLAPGERVDVEELAARAQGRWEVSPRVAYMGFLDARNRRDVLGSVMGLGASMTLRNLAGTRVGLRLDTTVASGTRFFTDAHGYTAAGDYQATTAGVALPWRFSVLTADLAFFAGPRLSAFYMERNVHVSAYAGGGTQSYLIVTPGAVAGASYAFGGAFTAGVEVQADWMLLRYGQEDRSTGFAEVMAGLGYRF